MYENVDFYLYAVKIIAGSQQGLAQTVYFKDGLRFELVSKWKWYFEYREALIKVANPKHYVNLSIVKYEYLSNEEAEIKARKNTITSKKATITKWENKVSDYHEQVKKYKDSWSSLFPIEEDLIYINMLANIERANIRIENAKNELLNLN